MNLLELPDDVLAQIIEELELSDLLSMRKTCTALSSITRIRSVWYRFLKHQVIEKNIPIHRHNNRPITVSSASDLERSVSNSLILYANWTSNFPVCTSETTFAARPTIQASRVITVQFLPGWLSQFLISVSCAAASDFLVQCWDTYSPSPKCIASRWYPEMSRVLVNSDPNHPTISVTSFSPSAGRDETFLLGPDLVADDPEFGFIVLKEVESFPQPIALQGSFLISTNSERIISVVNTDSARPVARLLHPAQTDARTDEFKCLQVFIGSDFIITFCKLWIFLYRLPHQTPEYVDTAPIPELEPESVFKWQRKVDSLAVSSRTPQTSPSSLSPVPSLNLAVRFDSWFPWPVNVIHLYFLPAPHESKLVPPTPVSAIPSPIRLFSPSDMIIGHYGTLMWIDGQIETQWGGVASEHGQRIASKMLSAGPLDMDKVGDDPAGLAIRFQVREDGDVWSCLAVDEETGRIAVGSVDGKISIFDYTPESLKLDNKKE